MTLISDSPSFVEKNMNVFYAILCDQKYFIRLMYILKLEILRILICFHCVVFPGEYNFGSKFCGIPLV